MSAVTPAFKEWAIITEALGQGHQALIIRKGGVHEGRRGFTPEHQRFWLFPTGFHQHAGKVEGTVKELDKTLSADKIQLQYIATVLDTYRVESLPILERLNPWHHWKWQTIEERFNFGKWQGVYVFVLDVHTFDTPIALENKKAYGGCKSWLELPLPWPADEKLSSVLNREQLSTIRQGVREILN